MRGFFHVYLKFYPSVSMLRSWLNVQNQHHCLFYDNLTILSSAAVDFLLQESGALPYKKAPWAEIIRRILYCTPFLIFQTILLLQLHHIRRDVHFPSKFYNIHINTPNLKAYCQNLYYLST